MQQGGRGGQFGGQVLDVIFQERRWRLLFKLAATLGWPIRGSTPRHQCTLGPDSGSTGSISYGSTPTLSDFVNCNPSLRRRRAPRRSTEIEEGTGQFARIFQKVVGGFGGDHTREKRVWGTGIGLPLTTCPTEVMPARRCRPLREAIRLGGGSRGKGQQPPPKKQQVRKGKSKSERRDEDPQSSVAWPTPLSSFLLQLQSPFSTLL